MKIKYTGVCDVTTTQGHEFIKGEYVEINNEKIIRKLKSNKFFECMDEKPKAKPKAKAKAKAEPKVNFE